MITELMCHRWKQEKRSVRQHEVITREGTHRAEHSELAGGGGV